MKMLSKAKFLLALLIPVLIFSFYFVSNDIVAAAGDEIVMFNTKSLKYHCPSCRWAKKCTRNCIKIMKSEAKKRGGIPCKVCGGSC
jgi:uncharacterized membrane protein